ncbi:hypothetical protein JJQ72_06180 [Paenibacillus sp. F411]|uniref:hypothetical protein n=1 Tax=Paenibacillus sp. F411 TaxID=2820239 RepID=UPI001AAFBC55|nr:hypothetical protein [Paenibacillus sp. F411]MBO2943564.1 hypothetical protein [Paenibacillus sp. F411]
MIRNQSIYIGPTIPEHGLSFGQVFFNGIPRRVFELMQTSAALQRLIVPIHLLSITNQRIRVQGSPEQRAYSLLASSRTTNQNDEGVTHIMSSSYYETPVPGRQYNSAGQIVNPADGVDPDGAQRVRVLGTAAAQTVTLQNNATAAGNGTPFAPENSNHTLTFEITGTSTSRTVLFEIAGPSGVYTPHTAFNVTDPTKFGTQTTGGSNTAPESWQVEVPAGYSFRARIGAVAGGNVAVKGKAVG